MDSSTDSLQRATTDFDDRLLSTAADNITDSDAPMNKIGFDIYFYSVCLFIFPVGVICNIFTVCVFVTSPTFRSNSTAQFLIALSVTDSLVLVGDVLRCLSMPNPFSKTVPAFLNTSNFACKFVYYWRQSCKLLSAWITVAITVERLIAVVRPLKIATLSTTRRARLVIVSLTLICFSLAAFPLWTIGLEQSEGWSWTCVVKHWSYKWWLTAIVLVMTLVLPSCIMIVCTAFIVFHLSRAERFRRDSTCVPTIRSNSAASISSFMSTQRQLSSMLVAVCCATVCLQMPYIITYKLIVNKTSTYLRVADMVATSNYAINFALYSASGSTFRNNVERMFHRLGDCSTTAAAKCLRSS